VGAQVLPPKLYGKILVVQILNKAFVKMQANWMHSNYHQANFQGLKLLYLPFNDLVLLEIVLNHLGVLGVRVFSQMYLPS